MRPPASSHWPALAFFAAMAAAGPLMDSFWQSLLTLVFFYAYMGLSWNLMMSAGLLSLGHALFLGVGAYATAVLIATAGLDPWLSLAAGAFLAASVGSALAWLGARFSVRGVHFALLTIAFAELFRVLFDNWELVGGTGGFFLKAINPETNRPLATLRGRLEGFEEIADAAGGPVERATDDVLADRLRKALQAVEQIERSRRRRQQRLAAVRVARPDPLQ